MGSGVFRYSTYPVSDLVTPYKVTPLPPLPITSPGRSAGVGGECTGQKQSLLPPRHSSTTLPKMESVWARAPAGLRRDAVLVYSNLGLFTSSRIFDLEILRLGLCHVWHKLVGEEAFTGKLQGSLILVRMAFRQHVSGKKRHGTSYCDVEEGTLGLWCSLISEACSSASPGRPEWQ